MRKKDAQEDTASSPITGEPRGRKVVDFGNLRQAVEQQKKLDADKPPDERAALIDVVRQFEPLIQARRNAKWTDAEICAWLVELGYTIDPATLRAYRSKLGILSATIEGASEITFAPGRPTSVPTTSTSSGPRQPSKPASVSKRSLDPADAAAAERPLLPQTGSHPDDAEAQEKKLMLPRRGPKPLLDLDDGV